MLLQHWWSCRLESRCCSYLFINMMGCRRGIFTHLYNLSLKKPAKKPAVMNRLSALHSARFSRNWFNSRLLMPADAFFLFEFYFSTPPLQYILSLSLWDRLHGTSLKASNGHFQSRQLQDLATGKRSTAPTNPVIKFTRCISMATLSVYKK